MLVGWMTDECAGSHVTQWVRLTALSCFLGGIRNWQRLQEENHSQFRPWDTRLNIREAPRWEKIKLFPGCRDTFQRASGSLEKAIALESWHMPTRWHGCPPGTSGGSAPAEQQKQGRWDLRDLPRSHASGALKTECRASCSPSLPR